ncbi:unnamed protein product [Ambrosiozyma monospora]|uniref:Unnamed protein product n=1 Tax=Ambrosiozyma monospora TaxID=43982 RepID=A0A9W6YYN7_AMBMO|nr:unnamed protein product [Ambrosiozyma monospora]
MSNPFGYVKQAGKILCIGRNYLAHIQELNNAKPITPFFFLKPSSSILLPNQGPILIPQGVKVHHEVELACIVGKTLQNLDPVKFGPEEALDSISGYALGIDLTARNVQNEAKAKGLPWSIAKGFDTFLPLSAEIPKQKITDPYNVELNLKINGQQRQKDLTNLMIFPIHKFLSKMSSIMTLQPGDIILTGTPKGVGPVVPGDVVEAWVSTAGDGEGKVLEESYMKFNAEEKPGPYFFTET